MAAPKIPYGFRFTIDTVNSALDMIPFFPSFQAIILLLSRQRSFNPIVFMFMERLWFRQSPSVAWWGVIASELVQTRYKSTKIRKCTAGLGDCDERESL